MDKGVRLPLGGGSLKPWQDKWVGICWASMPEPRHFAAHHFRLPHRFQAASAFICVKMGAVFVKQ
ncbi:hypothetical protein GCWU000324_00069 [Kingella oralis ATCC 51147]|uniref:Uncharacterized protein n=1 Tax=Kingella oralis ATCC 51147 TaxID=629741 RepID=C4GEI3_9NEIS|nr:hypothetical protein GCWU000324_00069 [Kingella oralis ATCC 51147]